MHNQKFFRAGEGRFVKLGHFDKHFVKNSGKRDPTEKLDTSQTAFWMENLTERWTQSRPICSKQGHLFRFWKRAGEAFSLSLPPFLFPICAPVSVTEYASISLKNILAKSWINCSDYVKTLNMHDHLTCSTDFWRWLRFSISQSSEYGTVVYLRVTPNSEYVWLWLRMPH